MSCVHLPPLELKKNKSDCRFGCLLLSNYPCRFFFLYHHVSQHIHAAVVSENTPTETDVFTPADCRCIHSDPNSVWMWMWFPIFLPNYRCVLHIFRMSVCTGKSCQILNQYITYGLLMPCDLTLIIYGHHESIFQQFMYKYKLLIIESFNLFLQLNA